MHIHILGICGTFMGGIAMIARQAGFEVSGSDANVYPPMSDELRAAGIEIGEGFGAEQLDRRPDLIVVGNVMRRGMPVVERMLNEGLRYVSGPQWLEEHYLLGRHVLAVAGTHGKTTTSSMLAWVLEQGGLSPGFLIGGVPQNFSVGARSSDSDYFVIEADEYDCAFFDKRSKFVHYHPTTLIMNNLEYDHADIFANVGEIQRQFHHLVRTVPGKGLIVSPEGNARLEEVLAMGAWTPVERVGGGAGLHATLSRPDGTVAEIFDGAERVGTLEWECTGTYNVQNALMVMAAARGVGIPLSRSISALGSFRLPRRRMELKGNAGGVAVYDDFAHHPTAIRLTLEGMRAHVGKERILAIFEPRSNSLKMGANREELGGSFASADEVLVYAPPSITWDVEGLAATCPRPLRVARDFGELLSMAVAAATPGTKVVAMSNGSFNGIHGKLLELLAARERGA
ncbi:MAG: UDP-N-acetylmuramate:L-alanyl-gamma-D-glutamyl-meso-diaminopimelate ligase [Succinivibrionaceae bacterium]|nr:UDP-N-acetylmuramate:L-alanyl-gamma-D-glutamyl-meso-diaminopimelate ligase [Succinivibrionaceae bacterium]